MNNNIEKNKWIAIASIITIIFLCIGLYLIFSYTRQAVQPTRAEIQKEIGNLENLTQQITTPINDLVNSDTTQTDYSNMLKNQNFYTAYSVQSFGMYELLSIPTADNYIPEIANLISTKSIINESQELEFPDDYNFFLFNKNTDEIYFLGYNLLYNFQETNFGDLNKWVFIARSGSSRDYLYMLDKSFSTLSFYDIKSNTKPIKIYLDEDKNLNAVYITNTSAESTTTSQVLTLNDLVKTKSVLLSEHSIKLLISNETDDLETVADNL